MRYVRALFAIPFLFAGLFFHLLFVVTSAASAGFMSFGNWLCSEDSTQTPIASRSANKPQQKG